MKHRVGVVGAGHVGAEAASEIIRRDIADCVLVDEDGDLAYAKALDLCQGAPVRGSSAVATGGDDLAALCACEVIVIAAGSPRRPGMTRDDLLEVNCGVIGHVVPAIARAAPRAVLVVVTNPLDAMTYATWKVAGGDPRGVLGMAGALDGSRFRCFLAGELGVSPDNVEAVVLGSHGDLMVPLARFASVGGIPATALVAPQAMARILERTRGAGTELVARLKTGSAWHAAGAAVAAIVDSVLADRRKVYTCSTLCRGEFGIDGVFVGVPAVVGARGIERVLELSLEAGESEALDAAVRHLRTMQQDVDRLLAQSGAIPAR